MAKRSNITLTLQQIQTAINNLTTECNNSIKYVPETDDYVEVQKTLKISK